MNLTLVGVRLRAMKRDLSSNFAHTSRLSVQAALLGIAFTCAGFSTAQTKPTPLTATASASNPETWDKLADTVFRHLSMQQGLPQYSATSLAQDSDGFIWVGTQGGLARWDGYRFRNYLPQANAPYSLPDNYVMSLHHDSQGRLWVGTNGGGLAMYDKLNDRFVRVPTGPGGVSHVTVNAITSDEKGNLWLATRAGLNHYDPQTGKVLKKVGVDAAYFAEGMVVVSGKAYQLTWQSGIGFVYDIKTFQQLRTFSYFGEGWGLTYDGKSMIMSDGTSSIRFLDPDSLLIRKMLTVTANGVPVKNLNELEIVNGELWANIWQTDSIARINPQTGVVLGWIDCSGLLTPQERSQADVLNGIAYDSKREVLLLTGKNWSKMFEVRVKSKEKM